MMESDRINPRTRLRVHYRQYERLQALADREGRRGVADILPDVIARGLAWESFLRDEFDALTCAHCRDSHEYNPHHRSDLRLYSEDAKAIKFVMPDTLAERVRQFADSECDSVQDTTRRLINTGVAYWRMRKVG
jgi:hypothetical protein